MKAVVYENPGIAVTKEVEKPKVQPNELLIRVRSCGICKTDLHLYHGKFLAKFPLVPGHEFSGEVVEIGNECKGFSIGDTVVADNTVLCGHCYYCRQDRPLYCENFFSRGVNASGGFAEYVIVGYDKVFKYADLDFDTATFAEPTACAIHGIDVIDMDFGDEVLLFGAGPTGMILAQLLNKGGAGKLVVVAPTAEKLDILNGLGIKNTVIMDRNDYSKHEKVLKKMNPHGFDIVIDATGHAPLLENGFDYCKMGGKVIAYGVYQEDASIKVNPYRMFQNEFKLFGSFAQTHCFDRAIQCLMDGTVRVEGLITKMVDLDHYMEGLLAVEKGGKNIKVVVHP